MFSCVCDRVQKACVHGNLVSGCAAFGVVLLTAAALTGCGGGNSSTSNMNSSNPGASSTSNLSISASLPAGTVGAGYEGTVTATGGVAPYTFSVVSGQLPAGVQLAHGTGSISGTPTTGGSFNFAVSVSDSKGDSEQKALEISVANNSSSGSGGSAGSGSSGGFGSSGSSGGSSGSSGSSSGAGSPGGSSGSSATTFPKVQNAGGWGQYGQGPPNFIDCSPSPCDGISFWMAQGVSNPSLSGSATEFNVGGTTPYSDALWNNHLIGPLSSQGTFDTDGSLVPSLYNFTYDVDFYGDNFGAAQALEFDINQYFSGMAFIYGHECRVAAGNEWDVWDDENAKWVPTGLPCYPKNNSWNHLTVKVQRTSDNHLTYQSISLNGQTTTLNWTFEHGSAPNWYGITVNYQMDGDSHQDSYTVYLDNLTFTFE